MRRNIPWMTILLAGALLFGGCAEKASTNGKASGADRSGTGAASAPGAIGGASSGTAGANSAAMNTPEGKALQAEVLTELQGLEQDLNAVEPGIVIDAEAEASGF